MQSLIDLKANVHHRDLRGKVRKLEGAVGSADTCRHALSQNAVHWAREYRFPKVLDLLRLNFAEDD